MEWITKLRLLEALVILATILVIMALIVNDMNRDNPIHVSIVVVVVTLTIWLLSIMFPESIYVDFRTHIVKLIALTIVISPCFAAYYNVVVNDGEEPECHIGIPPSIVTRSSTGLVRSKRDHKGIAKKKKK